MKTGLLTEKRIADIKAGGRFAVTANELDQLCDLAGVGLAVLEHQARHAPATPQASADYAPFGMSDGEAREADRILAESKARPPRKQRERKP